eukprot:PhM_4_TR4624/c0_g3_i1/m.43087
MLYCHRRKGRRRLNSFPSFNFYHHNNNNNNNFVVIFTILLSLYCVISPRMLVDGADTSATKYNNNKNNSDDTVDWAWQRQERAHDTLVAAGPSKDDATLKDFFLATVGRSVVHDTRSNVSYFFGGAGLLDGAVSAITSDVDGTDIIALPLDTSLRMSSTLYSIGTYPMPHNLRRVVTTSLVARAFHGAAWFDNGVTRAMFVYGGVAHGTPSAIALQGGVVAIFRTTPPASESIVWQDVASDPGKVHSQTVVALPAMNSFLMLFGTDNASATLPGVSFEPGTEDSVLSTDPPVTSVWLLRYNAPDWGPAALGGSGTWVRQTTTGTQPTDRFGAASVLYEGKFIVIYGGVGVKSHAVLSDLYFLDIMSWTFSKFSVSFVPRAYAVLHVALHSPSYVFLYGGIDELLNSTNTMQAFDFSDFSRVRVECGRDDVCIKDDRRSKPVPRPGIIGGNVLSSPTTLYVLPGITTPARNTIAFAGTYLWSVVSNVGLPRDTPANTTLAPTDAPTPRPTTLEEYIPQELTTGGTVAMSTSSTSSASSLVQAVVSGSLSAPVAVVTQLQMMVMIANMSCAPRETKELSVGLRRFLKPFTFDATPGKRYSHDIGNQLGTVVFFLLLLVAALCIYLGVRNVVGDISGDDVGSTMAVFWFPNWLFLPTTLLLAGSAHSAMTIMLDTSSRPVEKVLSSAVLLFINIGFLAYVTHFMYVHFISVDQHPYAELVRRGVSNSLSHVNQFISGSRLARHTPRLVASFLPVGFWTSQHLPDRTFNRRFSFLYEEYLDSCPWFLCVTLLRWNLHSMLFASGCDDNVLVWLCLVQLGYIIALAVLMPYRSRGTTYLHFVVEILNFLTLSSIYVEVVHGYAFAPPHVLLHTSAGLMLLLSLWSVLVLVTGYFLKRRAMAKNSATSSTFSSSMTASNNNNSSSFDMLGATTNDSLSGTISTTCVLTGTFWYRKHSGIPILRWYTDFWNRCTVKLLSNHVLYVYREDSNGRAKETPLVTINVGVGMYVVSPNLEKHSFTLKNHGTGVVHEFRANVGGGGAWTESEWCAWYERLHETVISRRTENPVLRGEGLMFSNNAELEDYADVGAIGVGAFGCVRHVVHTPSRNHFAMKIYDLRKMEGPLAKALIEEASVMQIIKHPYVVSLVRAYKTEDTVRLVMPLLNRGDLGAHLRRAQYGFPEFIVRFFAAEILLGLEHLHENNIMYRDLKPSNVVIDKEGHAVLVDLGFATRVELSQHFLGTPLYLAPEVIARTTYTKAVDWWAYGILVYELLTGHVPFYGASQQETFELITNTEPDYTLPTLSPTAVDLLRLLLVKSPMKRMTNPKLMRHHPFFRGFDFKKAERRKVPPPPLDPTTYNLPPNLSHNPNLLNDTCDNIASQQQQQQQQQSRQQQGDAAPQSSTMVDGRQLVNHQLFEGPQELVMSSSQYDTIARLLGEVHTLERQANGRQCAPPLPRRNNDYADDNDAVCCGSTPQRQTQQLSAQAESVSALLAEIEALRQQHPELAVAHFAMPTGNGSHGSPTAPLPPRSTSMVSPNSIRNSLVLGSRRAESYCAGGLIPPWSYGIEMPAPPLGDDDNDVGMDVEEELRTVDNDTFATSPLDAGATPPPSSANGGSGLLRPLLPGLRSNGGSGNSLAGTTSGATTTSPLGSTNNSNNGGGGGGGGHAAAVRRVNSMRSFTPTASNAHNNSMMDVL